MTSEEFRRLSFAAQVKLWNDEYTEEKAVAIASGQPIPEQTHFIPWSKKMEQSP